MVDANQVFTVPEALRRGRVYQELGCHWFEEPLPADNVDGLAELAAALDIPIASGENNFGKRQFRDLFTRRAVDIVQPDLRRAGGGTECWRSLQWPTPSASPTPPTAAAPTSTSWPRCPTAY